MRVTNKMLTDSVLNTINANLNKMDQLKEQLSSGKSINRPSDDPISTAQLLAAKSALNAQKEYHRNMEDAMGWLDTTDGALANANEVLQRSRELAVYGSNGTLPEQSMNALADEVNKLVEEMVQIANTNYAGRFIFGGGNTTKPPFEITGTDNSGVTEVQFINSSFDESLLDETYKLKFEIESGVTIDVSAGEKTFHTDANGNADINAVFNTMIKLRQELQAGNKEEISSLIDEFDKFIDNVLSERAVVGANSKRMRAAQDRSSIYELNLNKLLGRLGDVDYAEATMNFKVQEAVYHASLATGARLIQPSLIDFLK